MKGHSGPPPDEFTADLRHFGQFTGAKQLQDVRAVDMQQWIGQLKQDMPPKTVSRQVSAVRNCFRWLEAEQVLTGSPAERIWTPRVRSPLPRLLFDNECEQLLAAASTDPRTYVSLLVPATGLKKAELLELRVTDFDFSNHCQPEVWIRHSGKHACKERRLKLSREVTPGVR